MQALAGWEGTWLQVVQDAPTRQAIADLIRDGDWQQWTQRSFREEVTPWLHLHASSWVDGLPGSAQPGDSSQDTNSPMVVRTFDLWRDKAEEGRDHQLDAGEPVLAVLGTFADTPSDWFAAGIAMERVLQEACASGLQPCFVTQPTEIPSLRARLCRMRGRADFPQVILRIGSSDPAPSPPRRSMGEVLFERPVSDQWLVHQSDEERTSLEGETR